MSMGIEIRNAIIVLLRWIDHRKGEELVEKAEIDGAIETLRRAVAGSVPEMRP